MKASAINPIETNIKAIRYPILDMSPLTTNILMIFGPIVNNKKVMIIKVGTSNLNLLFGCL